MLNNEKILATSVFLNVELIFNKTQIFFIIEKF